MYVWHLVLDFKSKKHLRSTSMKKMCLGDFILTAICLFVVTIGIVKLSTPVSSYSDLKIEKSK